MQKNKPVTPRFNIKNANKTHMNTSIKFNFINIILLKNNLINVYFLY